MITCVTAIEAKLDGSNWTDITADVIKPIPFSYGILANGPIDRVANIGEMSFDLRNDAGNSGGLAGYYTPGHVNCRSGFTTGLQIRLRCTYDGATKTIFKGRIPAEGINVAAGLLGSRRVTVAAGLLGSRRVTVVVRDFMEQATNHELKSPAFVQNKNMMEVVPLILANMAIGPDSTDYRTGSDTFPSVFDTVRATTRAASEMFKVANSEMGFIYPIHTLTGDEVLRVEGRYTRNDERPAPTIFPLATALSGFLLAEDGTYLLAEDSSKIVLDETSTVSFTNAQSGMVVTGGKHFYNRIKVTVYPRKVDASVVTLATLQNATAIGAGETITFTLRFRDPAGLTSNVSGIDMVTPLATTDYLCNTAANGSGSNLTASTTVVATFGTGDVELAFTNASASAGYILAGSKVRGKGVYLYDPVDVIAEDATSINAYGPYQLSVDMKYQDDPAVAYSFAAFLLAFYKDPRLVLETITLYANRNDDNMSGFFYLNPGDRLAASETITGMNGEYFINGVEGEVLPGDIIRFTWHVRDAGFDTFDFANWDNATAEQAWDSGQWAL